MKKTVVIYESRYGATKRYAQWIAQALSCPLFKRKDFHPKDFEKYSIIIYGGGLYAGGVSGIKLITENRELLADRKVILFTCGLADPQDAANVSNIRTSLAKILSPELLTQIQLFHLRGSIDYSRLSLLHRCMMAMFRRMLLKKAPDNLNEESRSLLETYGKRVDFTDRRSIQPLLEYVASLQKHS